MLYYSLFGILTLFDYAFQLCFRYLDNRVFVALANGDICVYMRDSSKFIVFFVLFHIWLEVSNH